MCQTSLTTTKPPTATEALVSLTAISQRGAIQRLLLAIAVVLVPVCSNLPCCCKRAAASEASCCKKSETTASCCQSKSPKASKAVSSCCDIKKSSSTERSTGSSFKLPSCECCVQATTPEPVITVVPRSADKPKHSSLVAAILPTEKGFFNTKTKQARRRSACYAIVCCIYVFLHLRMPDEI